MCILLLFFFVVRGMLCLPFCRGLSPCTSKSLSFAFHLSFQMAPTRPKRQTRRPKRFATAPTVAAPADSPQHSAADHVSAGEPVHPPSQPQPPALDTATFSTLRTAVAQEVLTTLLSTGLLPAPAPTALAPEPAADFPAPPTTSTPQGVDAIHAGNTNSDHLDLPTFQPATLPLGATIDPKLKSKIWAGEYIDLASLGTSPSQPPDSFAIGHGRSAHSVAIAPPSKAHQIRNISEWTDLFHIFAAVYTERFPLPAPHIFKYASVVRNLANRCSVSWWLFYDTQFRRLKAHSTDMSWGVVHHELYLHCLGQASVPFRPGPYAANLPRLQRRGPDGYCWKQWFGGKCDRPDYQFRHSPSVKPGNHKRPRPAPSNNSHSSRQPSKVANKP